MDVKTLIREIFARPTLWDRKDKNHHNRFVLNKLWVEVAVKFNTTPNAVRNKWKSLRDKFRTKLASISKPQSGDPQLADYKYEWKYFKSLLFLKDQFTSRKSDEHFSDKDDDDNFFEELSNNLIQNESGNDNENQQYISTQDNVTINPQDALINVTPCSSRHSSFAGQYPKARNTMNEGINDVILQVKREKLRYLQEKRTKKDEDDEDLNFFKSLLPHVKTFSSYDKMEYRMRVTKVTQEFLRPSQNIPPETRDIPEYSFTSNGFKTETTY